MAVLGQLAKLASTTLTRKVTAIFQYDGIHISGWHLYRVARLVQRFGKLDRHTLTGLPIGLVPILLRQWHGPVREAGLGYRRYGVAFLAEPPLSAPPLPFGVVKR